jgi:hypothetical protein
MSQIDRFSNLVEYAQRGDGYINATKWCEVFGYDLRNWKRLPETKARLKALQATELGERNETLNTECVIITHSVSKKSNVKNASNATESVIIAPLEEKKLIYSTGKGYGAVTWIHPIMAVHLASYLDPDFANYVAKVFVRYITADPTLAADIASRQETTKGLDIINEAVEKRYSFIEGRDWSFYSAWSNKVDQTETEFMRLLEKEIGLPYRRFAPIDLNSTNTVDILKDFTKEKHPSVYPYVPNVPGLVRGRLTRKGIKEISIIFALTSYFKEEIEGWLKEKNGI